MINGFLSSFSVSPPRGSFPRNAFSGFCEPQTHIPIASVRESSEKRFRGRAGRRVLRTRSSYWAMPLRNSQRGGRTAPTQFPRLGTSTFLLRASPIYPLGSASANSKKIRTCGDLKDDLAILATTVLTPITLPSMGHISQLRKNVPNSGQSWVLLKADHRGAYKKLPLAPERCNLSIIALRFPSSGKWMGFIPRALLFGAVSAVIPYNCFSRAFAVLINRMFGIPLLSY